jgi:hypothetical protein
MKKDQVDLVNATVWIPDSKTPNGIAEIPLTPLATDAFKSQMMISGDGPFLFPSAKNPSGHHDNLKTAWRRTLKRAGVPYFRIYDLRSTYATRLSAGGVADERVTQLVRQGDAKRLQKVFSNEIADETRSLGEDEPLCERNAAGFWYRAGQVKVFATVLVQSRVFEVVWIGAKLESALESIVHFMSGRSAAW